MAITPQSGVFFVYIMSFESGANYEVRSVITKIERKIGIVYGMKAFRNLRKFALTLVIVTTGLQCGTSSRSAALTGNVHPLSVFLAVPMATSPALSRIL